MGISSPNKFNYAHTHLSLKKMDQKRNHPSPPIPPLNSTRRASNAFNRSLVAFFYYARAVDMTVLTALSMIAIEQTKTTEMTMNRRMQLLDYLASNQEAKVRLHASDMIMNIHSDVSYLTKNGAQSRACRHFFMGWMPKNGEPIN
jgi:hypothetical protein